MGFGEEVAISHPEPPKNVQLWSDIERLNRERELVGIYLSAHPLDEYSIILNHVCNTKVSELENKAELATRSEITFGGIVTAIRTGETKNGKPYGIVRIEDFNGAGEIPLFGKDWLTLRNFFIEGTSLFIKGKMSTRKWGDGYELTIGSVDLLADVKDSLIDKISFSIQLNRLTTQVVEELAIIAKCNPGRTEVYFNIHTGNNMNVRLFSRSVKVSITKALVQYIEEHPELTVTINDNSVIVNNAPLPEIEVPV